MLSASGVGIDRTGHFLTDHTAVASRSGHFTGWQNDRLWAKPKHPLISVVDYSEIIRPGNISDAN